MSDKITVVHEGRGGYVEYQNVRYTIDHVGEGCFCIHFPDGKKHKDLKIHQRALTAYAESHDPKWYVGS
nr:hypothetical protein [uncultured Hyphomonas sp.]